MSSKQLLTLAIPCLNEGANLRDTLADIFGIIPRVPMDVDVVMIDDASTDNTRDVMSELARQYPRCRVVCNERNLGTGRSVMQLYDELDPESWFSAIPGDNEIVAASLLNYLAVAERHDVILGYLQNPVIRTVVRRAASAAFTTLSRLAYGFPYRYLNGPKLYRIRAFKGIKVVGGGHAFNAELLAKALLRDPSLRITEVPFMARGRFAGSSSAFTPRAIVRAAKDFYVGHSSVIEYRQDVIARETEK